MPVRRLVRRRGTDRGRRARSGNAGPGQGARGHPERRRQGLLPPQGLSDRGRGAPGDRPPDARPVPGAQGPRAPRALRVAAPGDPRGGEEGDLRRRVRAARRRRDREAPRGPSPAPALGRHRRALDAPARPRDAGPDGRRDRAPRLEDLLLAQGVRRGGLLRGPRREGADVAQGGRARVRPAALLARRRRGLCGPEGLAPEAPGALLARRPRRRDPDPQGHPPDGDLRLRKEPLRQDDLDALEPAPLPPRHERRLRNRQPGADLPAGAARGRGRVAGGALDRRDRDGRGRVPRGPGRARCRASSRAS